MENSVSGTSPPPPSLTVTEAITVVATAVVAVFVVIKLIFAVIKLIFAVIKLTVTEAITVVATAVVAVFVVSKLIFAVIKLISSSLSPSSHSDVGRNQIPKRLMPYCISPEQQGDILLLESSPPTGVIKIMCYNIWSLEEFKIQERMEAISQLILQHSPDIVLLQEVTPFGYKFFQTCDWWRTYQCSVKREEAARQIFCMQLSRLHVETFFCKPLKNTTTERGLYIARIKVGPNNNKKLTVATCHLKRPTDSDMYITERVGNAKEAISELHSEANVVFGGDMNWSETSDGSFPLLDGWRDAWSVLRPTEDGPTYDTTTNRMMSHSRLRKSRLDRFFCKMNDFKMDSIERIGMEEIPGVFYEHNGEKLPILPSDHYGLLLTISPKVVNVDA